MKISVQTLEVKVKVKIVFSGLLSILQSLFIASHWSRATRCHQNTLVTFHDHRSIESLQPRLVRTTRIKAVNVSTKN